MSNLIFYNPIVVMDPKNALLPGVRLFSEFAKIFKKRALPIDRTHTVEFPVVTKSLFPVPTFKPLNKTYADICGERALEILAHADTLEVNVYVLWSGGIDSTLTLVSLLSHASKDQRARIVVLLDENSIRENTRFFDEHIKGKLRTEISSLLPQLIGMDDLLVSGELNDQLFGSDMNYQLMQRFGVDVIHKPYAPDIFLTHLTEKGVATTDARRYIELFERMKNAAPITLTTNFDFVWWINFALKWQWVYFRTLARAAPRRLMHIDAAYCAERYFPFFNTTDFQLWSMINLDMKIQNTWETYKWPAKDIIYQFTHDDLYQKNKTKHHSLQHLFVGRPSFNFIDEHFLFSDDMPVATYHNPKNDFV